VWSNDIFFVIDDLFNGVKIGLTNEIYKRFISEKTTNVISHGKTPQLFYRIADYV
jgi:hypothetical protein